MHALSLRRRHRLARLDAAGLLAALEPEQRDFACILAETAYWFRCGGAVQAASRMAQLQAALRRQPDICAQLGHAFFRWLQQTHLYPGLVSLGLFSRHGMMREIGTHLYDRFNPPPQSALDLRDVLAQAFDSRHDAAWLNAIEPAQWRMLYHLLGRGAGREAQQAAARHFLSESLHALEMLSIWVAAEELNPDLVRIDRRLLDVDSPFVALQREISLLVRQAQSRLTGNSTDAGTSPPADEDHARVMLDQCHTQVARLKRRGTGVGTGSSMAVAHLLERLEQTLNRLELLLDIHTRASGSRRSRCVLHLCRQLIQAAATRRTIGTVWQSSVKMLSQSITQNTSNHGEHYITRTRSEYWHMLRSAAGAGVIIALMALLKIRIGHLGLGPGLTTLLTCLNYGLGFVLVHMLHFTIATKQPAMTAASFAAAVQRNERGRAQSARLAELLIDVNRSQSIAVIGNVSIAICVAIGLSLAAAHWLPQPLVDPHSADYLLKANRPIAGLALYYAAIAAVWLFCSGIIAGFFDNRANYLQLEQRISNHPLLRRLLPENLRQRLGRYLHEHYGSMAGNFLFGVLLGLTGYIGHLTGLPLDIRHVAFSSANLGYAAITTGMHLPAFLLNLCFVLMIGMVNLWVSFALALIVALRARDARLGDWGSLFEALRQQIKQQPWSLIFPPAKRGDEAAEQNGDGKTGS